MNKKHSPESSMTSSGLTPEDDRHLDGDQLGFKEVGFTGYTNEFLVNTPPDVDSESQKFGARAISEIESSMISQLTKFRERGGNLDKRENAVKDLELYRSLDALVGVIGNLEQMKYAIQQYSFLVHAAREDSVIMWIEGSHGMRLVGEKWKPEMMHPSDQEDYHILWKGPARDLLSANKAILEDGLPAPTIHWRVPGQV